MFNKRRIDMKAIKKICDEKHSLRNDMDSRDVRHYFFHVYRWFVMQHVISFTDVYDDKTGSLIWDVILFWLTNECQLSLRLTRRLSKGRRRHNQEESTGRLTSTKTRDSFTKRDTTNFGNFSKQAYKQVMKKSRWDSRKHYAVWDEAKM